MHQGDEEWLATVDAFNAAALGAGEWLEALAGLAALTGSRCGQLIGLGSETSIPFNWVTDLGQDYLAEFAAAGGADPAVNPVVRVGSQIPALKIMVSGDFITPEERRTNPFLVEQMPRYDIPHICLTPLIKESNMLVGLAVIRSGRQGEIEARQRALFASLAPHVRAAVKTQMALEHQGAQLMAGALEALALDIFICDRHGAVKAMTPGAEALVSRADALRLRRGWLQGTRHAETRPLTDAIAAAAGGMTHPGAPLSSTLLIHGQLLSPLIVQILPLPRRDYTFGFEPRVLVVVRGARPAPNRLKGLLETAYRLTAAEADVAQRLAAGQPPEMIAAARRASVGTVRAQIRAIYAKLNVHRQSELISRLNQLR
ncbi:MAG TPA: helix-turn-helix transcriptional regulator [Gammaproteobacteria bacterium]